MHDKHYINKVLIDFFDRAEDKSCMACAWQDLRSPACSRCSVHKAPQLSPPHSHPPAVHCMTLPPVCEADYYTHLVTVQLLGLHQPLGFVVVRAFVTV